MQERKSERIMYIFAVLPRWANSSMVQRSRVTLARSDLAPGREAREHRMLCLVLRR